MLARSDAPRAGPSDGHASENRALEQSAPGSDAHVIAHGTPWFVPSAANVRRLTDAAGA